MSREPPDREEPQRVDGGRLDEQADPIEGVGFVEDFNVLLPDGEYTVGYTHYETVENYFGKPRVFVHFGVIEPEDYAGSPLTRFYCVNSVVPPGRKYGDFRPPGKGRLVREFRAVIGSVGRLDRISFARFKGLKIRAHVETVNKGSDGRHLEPCDQYSKISRLLGALPDRDGFL